MSDARATAALFDFARGGLVSVTGDDGTTWLNGMVSNDVAALEPGPERSGCHAAWLTNRGAIIADLHVVARESGYWLLVEQSAVATTIETLGRFIVADDVTLTDESDAWAQWTLEGPCVPEILDALGAGGELADGSARDVSIAGVDVTLVAIGLSGEPARRLIAPAADRASVEAAVLAAGAALGLARGTDAELEALRIEWGTPRQGFELDDSVLPDEARLDSAISTTKGCYVGQEIVARLRSRGQVNHLLVGLHFAGELPAVGVDLHVGDKRTGEITSAATSPRAGAIALGFVRREHSEPGTSIDAAGTTGIVTTLPFVEPGSAGGAA